MNVIVIEDNPLVAKGIQQALQMGGYNVDVAMTGCEGEEMAASGKYDGVVLDVMLPDRDGVTVCRNLRRRGLGAPILMLTALSSTRDKVTGLDAGADDYVPKPFELDELLARVRALTRRGQMRERTTMKVDDLELDLLKRVATRGQEIIRLSAKEFALLDFLMRNAGKPLSRMMIGQKVWDMNFEPASNVVDVFISALRRKIEQPGKPKLIHTITGVGYRFGADDDEHT
jgi:DNA-binding response OmpR family regulator